MIQNDFAAIELLASTSQRDGKLLALTTLMLRFPQFGSATLSDMLVLDALSKSQARIRPLDKEALAHAINQRYFVTRNDRSGARETNELLRELAASRGLILLNKEDFVCDREADECLGVSREMKKLLRSFAHHP